MKEKLGIIFVVFIAILCLFGCGEELPAEEMVLGYDITEADATAS